MTIESPKYIDKEYIHTGKEVVVTGFGGIAPIGNNAEEIWASMLAGKSGVVEYDTGHPLIHIAAPVQRFDPRDYFDRKTIRRDRMYKTDQLAVAAAQEALVRARILVDEKIKLSQAELERTGIRIGTLMGGSHHIIHTHEAMRENPDEWWKGGTQGKRVSLRDPLKTFIDHSVSVISLRWGFKESGMTVTTACATGNDATIAAARSILLGEADIIVACGVESALIPETFAGISMLGALGTGRIKRGQETIEFSPEEISRPFDKDAHGFVIGEGAVALILERRDHAEARGAPIFARLAGYGPAMDAYHETAPEPEGKGAIRAMAKALARSNLSRSDIDVVFAHGTSTRIGDPAEVKAIRDFFGEYATRVAVVPTKDKVGHLIGAAGIYTQLAAIKAIQENKLPPAINLVNPIEGVRTGELAREGEGPSFYVPTTIVKRPIRRAMINAFGFGGKNAVVIFEQVG